MVVHRRALQFLALLILAGAALPAAAVDYLSTDWTLPTASGGTVNLREQLAQGPVVVSFWALWCNPCLKELPQMNRLAGEYASKATFIAVNIDNSKSVAKVQPYVQSRGYDDVIVALDTAGDVQQIMQIGGMIPFVVVFDANGAEAFRHIGYKDGDEEEVRLALETLLTQPTEPLAASAGTGGVDWRDALSVRDQFKYKYDTSSDEEQVENWLDVVYLFGDFRTGILLDHQAPSEEGNRRNKIVHRFFEYNNGDAFVRVGQFYGMFGRGIVFNSYEDRNIRVDTSLDGIYVRGQAGPADMQVFSGTTGTASVLDATSGAEIADVDVRGLDAAFDVPLAGALGLPWAFKVGGTALTYEPSLLPSHDDIKREWVASGRASLFFGKGDAYFEYGHKTGFDVDPTTLDKAPGKAYYGNLNLYTGPVSLSVEHSDYRDFSVIKRADGKQPLNRPPALVREHIYTLLNRAPHNLDPDDEKGWQVEANYTGPHGWNALANASRIANHANEHLFEEIYGHLEQERLGDFRFRAGFGYRDSEDAIRQTVIGELTWYQSAVRSWTLQAEQQHVRLGVLGKYDQQWYKLEHEIAPHWAFDAILETNNKFDAQLGSGEVQGSSFPAGQVSYTLDDGGSLNVWFGKRQAGYLCSGGVCKFEPAFEGVECFGVFRY